jgi:hypothetical protein
VVQELADERARARRVDPDQVELAASLLGDLWAAASRHNIAADHRGVTTHLPRAALDTLTSRPPQRRPDAAS